MTGTGTGTVVELHPPALTVTLRGLNPAKLKFLPTLIGQAYNDVPLTQIQQSNS